MGQLDGRDLRSTGVTVDGRDRPLVPGTVVSLLLRDGRVAAAAGCNRMMGGARLDGGVLVVDQLATSLMACEPELMAQDDWVAELLTSRPVVGFDGDTVTLTAALSSGTTVLTLVDARGAPLIGTEWVVEEVVDQSARRPLPADVRPPTLRFGDDGRMAGFAGCNRLTGTIEIGDATITFGPLALTRMLCGPAEMEVEAAVTRVLVGEVRYRIEADELRLDGPTGALLLRAR